MQLQHGGRFPQATCNRSCARRGGHIRLFPEAKRLYENLGYVDWGQGEFLISWEYIDRNGNTGTESEIVTYMHKRL